MRCSAIVLTLVCALSFQVSAFSQTDAQPTFSDVAYADNHSSQRLDVYLAKSESPVPAMIFFHGGGWRAGSKSQVPQWLRAAVNEGWLSVVAVEYRFTDVAIHPAQVDDCQCAIQYVRHHASKWNIDPARIGVTGGSAGGHLSLWTALQDDIADPSSQDPVKQHSSRVSCAISFAGPTDWTLLESIDHQHPAYRQLIGAAPGTPYENLDATVIKSVSPISLVTADDPAIMQVHGDADDIVPIEHARVLDEKLRSLGVRSELVIIKNGNHGVAGAAPNVSAEAAKFAREALR